MLDSDGRRALEGPRAACDDQSPSRGEQRYTLPLPRQRVRFTAQFPLAPAEPVPAGCRWLAGSC